MQDAMTNGMMPVPPSPQILSLLKTMKTTWRDALQAAQREKDRVYTPGARECLKLYLGDFRAIFNPAITEQQFSLFVNVEAAANAKRRRQPVFLINDNMAARLVQTYLPWLKGEEIVRTVSANKPYLPPPEAYGLVPPEVAMQAAQAGNMQFLQQQQMLNQQYQSDLQQLEQDYRLRVFRATLQEALLNYNVKELALNVEMELAIIESLVIGGGCIMTGSVDMPGGAGRLVGSKFVPFEDILYDPDVTRARDAKWIAIRFRYPKWMVSRMTGIPEDELKGTTSSMVSDQQYRSLLVQGGNDMVKTRKIPMDEVEIWQIWSRMGCGARLQDVMNRDQTYAMMDEKLSDFNYFLISDCCDYPLNLPPMLLQQMINSHQQTQVMGGGFGQNGQPYDPVDILRAATKWPVSYYLDEDDPWPITLISYHQRTGSPYPIPHLEFALSYVKFMVWVLGYIADKTYRSQRDFWIVDETTSATLINEIQNGEDEPIVRIKRMDQQKIQDFVQFLEAPPLKKDILEVYAFFQRKFEEMTGLTDLLQAVLQRQMRSATEAQVVDNASRLKPDKMASDVDYGQTRIARKEAIAAQELLKGQDLAFLFGRPGAMAWDQAVQQTNAVMLLREASFDVESGRGKKLDIKTKIEQTSELVQYCLPIALQFAQETGITDTANGMLIEWAKARQIDPDLVKLPSTQQMQQIQMQKMQAQMQMEAQQQMAVQGHAAAVAPKKKEPS